jgi:hypothetical protein
MKPALNVLAACELLGLYLLWRLWRCKNSRSLHFRIFWSVLLLVPVLGVVFYGLAANDPSEKPGEPDENNQGWGDYPSGNP